MLPLPMTHQRYRVFLRSYRWLDEKVFENKRTSSWDVTLANAAIQSYEHTMQREGWIKVSEKKKKKQNFKWQGYTNISIGISHEQAAIAYLDEANTTWEDMTSILQDGYSIKFAHDAEQNVIRCTLTCMNDEDPNYGWAMSAWGSDFYKALASALFKHIYIAKENWELYKQETRSGDFG